MSEKNWLVRTFDKKILGPISRDRLIALLQEGKLSESDEICPGNHYWVYVKEKELCAELLEAPELLAESVEEVNSSHNNEDDSCNSKNNKEKKKSP